MPGILNILFLPLVKRILKLDGLDLWRGVKRMEDWARILNERMMILYVIY